MSLFRTSLGLTLCKSVNQALGVFLALGQAAVFGVGSAVDALFAATFLSVIWARELARVVRIALIPCLIEGAPAGSASAPLAARFQTVVLAGAVVVALLVLAAAPWLVGLLTPGFDDQTATRTVELLRVMAPGVVPLILLGAVQAHLHVRRRFLIPELGDLVWKAIALAALLVAGSPGGVAAYARWITVGAFAALGVVAVLGRGAGLAFERPWSLTRADVAVLRPFWAGALVVFCSVTLRQLDQTLDRIFLSALAPGALSVFSHASRLVQLGPFLLATSLLMPFLPELVRARARGTDVLCFARQITVLLVAVGVPLALLLAWGARDLVELLLLRGRFDRDSAEAAIAVVRILAFGIPALFGIQGLNGLFLMERNMREVWRTGVAGLVFHLLGNALLVSHGVDGVALAGTVAAWLSAGFLWWRAGVGRTGGPTGFAWGRFGVAVALLAATLFAVPWARWLPSPWIRLPLAAAAALGLYALLMGPALQRLRASLVRAVRAAGAH